VSGLLIRTDRNEELNWWIVRANGAWCRTCS